MSEHIQHRAGPSRRAFLAASVSAFALSGCSAVGTFNAIIPSDSGVEQIAAGRAYGSDPRQTFDVYAPTARSGAPLPVVVFIYGGSWNSGSKSEYAFAGKALAAQGFVTAVIDYRLRPQIRFPDFLDDCARGVAYVAAHAAEFGGDRRRVFVLGHSSGAYNAVMIALDPKYLARAGSSTTILRGAGGLAGPYDFLPFDVEATIDTFGKWPRTDETQPISFTRAGAPPLFLATGSDDTTVYPRNTTALARKQRAAGGRVTEKVYPGIGHAGILTALTPTFRDKAPVLADVTAFFKSL